MTIWLVDQIVFVLSGSKSSSSDPCVLMSCVLTLEHNAAIPLELIQFQVILGHRFHIVVLCQRRFSIEM
jgi:hypothetical protein